MTVTLHHGDILRLHVDAVVNAANTELQHTGSLAAAISKRAVQRSKLTATGLDRVTSALPLQLMGASSSQKR